ncbi:hypothetical protein BKA56DRAFT_506862 [Ilyonectria sp. MPI-CAGE-AT-0026]|nr:hypothetical protein BKA56DRAFT_506862 [Ilyonectria sp. MPI-CAGE-AT-0026]
MLAITEEENSKLSRGTSAPLYNSHGRVDGYYVVQTTMSHQLHCLKIFRDLIWDLYVEKTQDYDKTAHADHCIGYFRQHVLCHSDLTPIYFQWDGKANSYRTDPHPTHSCRSWDAIWKWSAGRNKTGMRVHADHVKVFKEFQALHGTDMHSGHHAGHSD